MKKKKPTQDSENKQIKEQKQTHRHREHIGGYQRGRGLREGRVEEVSKIWVKGVKCKVMDGSQTFGDDHFVMNTDVEL